MSERDLQLRAEDPTLSPQERLGKRVDDLEDAISSKRIDIKQLPVAALQRRLFNEWQPEGDRLLLPASVGPDSLAATPHARVAGGSSAAQDTTSGVTLPVPFGVVTYDEGADADQFSFSSPTRLTCQRSGLYTMSAYIVWPAEGAGVGAPAGTIWAQWINHSADNNLARKDAQRQDIAPGIQIIETVTTEYRMVKGEYIELHAFQNTGAGRRITTAQLMWSWISN